MKIVFNRKEISDAVAPLMCAVSGKSTQASIDGILIEANEDHSCVMTTFDTEKGMRIKINDTEGGGGYFSEFTVVSSVCELGMLCVELEAIDE